MGLVFQEYKKIWKRKSVIIVLLILCILNVYNIVRNHADKNLDGYWTIHEKIKGPMTQEKIDFVMRHYNECQKIVESGMYEQEKPDDRYFTGYVFGDFHEIGVHRKEMERIFLYNDTIKKVKAAALKNIDIYGKKENTYEVKRNKKITRVYGERNLTEYYDTSGFNNYLSYDFSSLLIIMLLLFALSPSFTHEKKCGMSALIQSCKKGGQATVLAKKNAALLFTVSISACIYLTDLLSFLYSNHLSGYTAPIYQIKQYAFSPLVMDIWQYCLLSVCIKIFGCCIFAMLFLFISSFISEILFTFSINAAVSFLLIGLYGKGMDILNPVAFLCNRDSFRSIVTFNLGFPAEQYILVAIIGVLEFFLLYMLMHRTYKLKLSLRGIVRFRKPGWR